jgi:hypothetical protein
MSPLCLILLGFEVAYLLLGGFTPQPADACVFKDSPNEPITPQPADACMFEDSPNEPIAARGFQRCTTSGSLERNGCRPSRFEDRHEYGTCI